MSKRLVIVHGYTAAPSQNWFPWLTDVLTPQGFQVHVPALPDPDDPQVAAWVDAAAAAVGQPDEDLVVVGHSLGCITALRALDRLQGPWQLGGLVLVSGFDEPVPTLPMLDPFVVDAGVDYARLGARTRLRAVLTSDTDDIVPMRFSASLAERLDASLDVIPGRGHFLDDELPILVERIAAAFPLA